MDRKPSGLAADLDRHTGAPLPAWESMFCSLGVTSWRSLARKKKSGPTFTTS
jgi:hypothetical protein